MTVGLAMDKRVKSMTKSERIAELEARVAELKSAYEEAEWELEKLKGGGPLMDRLFQMIEASGKTHEEVIAFLEGKDPL